MEQLQVAHEKAIHFYQIHPRAVQIAAGLFGFYVLNKVANCYWYSRRLFSNASEIEDKVVLITGCDTGFGHGTALKLSIVCGYKVIATCLKQESVDAFLSNSEFTNNGSTALVMDVTKQADLLRAREFITKYLNETNSILWGLVNNAGIVIGGEFEVVPKEFDELERNIMLGGPLQITREFLPLIYGRKNYQTIQSTKTANNGGRIVNVTSLASYFLSPGMSRYGVSKAALSYFSHTLRMELSPRFGIWVNEVAPGGYQTPIGHNVAKWTKRVQDKLAESGQSDLLQIYDSLTAEEIDRLMSEAHRHPHVWSPTIEPVVDCIIHGLTAKYPERTYRPGWVFPLGLLTALPYWITEPLFSIQAYAQTKLLRSK